ncbi:MULTISPECIES: chemotaxis protein CheW [Cyanophyceae]|uniref:chemotaxis protein CheW n=1 Tax=Cyanophyceae TaxID=3028117 RepID=UPI001685147C|nr:chemotaxis protein CheW [Trichocoleus sp. FACHB-69]MBD1931525.1 purine-binding chemotaxis protein CheW [Trichocoleus sp. FACHB-69]
MESELLSTNTTLAELFKTHTPGHTAVVGQQFLRFHLLPDTTALLPVHQMTEVLTIPINQIVPIPHLPAWIMGVYNWRGEILWMVDLGRLVGLTPLYQHAISRSTYTVIVIHSAQQVLVKQRIGTQITGRKMLGLVVNQVEDMEWCDPNLIQSPLQSAVTLELLPFLRGYWIKSTGEMLVVLDSESVFAGMPNQKC